MKELEIKAGFLVRLDDDDYDLVSRTTWTYRPAKISDHSPREIPVPYRFTKVDPKPGCKSRLVRLPRLLMDAGPNQVVHVLDGDGLNCQKSNLVLTTRAAIALEAAWSSHGADRGIFYDRRWAMFQAYAIVNGEIVFVGRFAVLDDAIAARNAEIDRLLRKHAPAMAVPGFPLDRLRSQAPDYTGRHLGPGGRDAE